VFKDSVRTATCVVCCLKVLTSFSLQNDISRDSTFKLEQYFNDRNRFDVIKTVNLYGQTCVCVRG